jgi:DNA-binding response OmpR family regulator
MDIPILVLSLFRIRREGLRIGVDRYLTKPIDTVLLFNEIGSLLEQGTSRKKVMIANGHLDGEHPIEKPVSLKKDMKWWKCRSLNLPSRQNPICPISL